MPSRLLNYIRTKPRTSILIALLAVSSGGFFAWVTGLSWNSGRAGALLTYAPLLLCLVMHAFMHRGHGGHGGHGAAKDDTPTPQEIPVESEGTRTHHHGRD